MRAAVYDEFGGDIVVREVPDPSPGDDDIVLRVMANGICRSDWHGWMGHDADIVLPHVPGHECAGVVESIGRNVKRFRRGDRVIVPFSGGCGHCNQCAAGRQNICDNDFQPGFSAWGAFAKYCRIGFADLNLVPLPDEIGFVEAASLGCRCMTSFGGIVDQAQVLPGEFVVVFGCGGVGLSAIMIANAIVIAVDTRKDALALAKTAGALHVILDQQDSTSITQRIEGLTEGGAHVSVDAIGIPTVVSQSIKCLRKRGRHIQIGLLNPSVSMAPIPMNLLVAKELSLIGSHGLPFHRFPELLKLVKHGKIRPGEMVTRTVSLDDAGAVLMQLDEQPHAGIAIIDRF